MIKKWIVVVGWGGTGDVRILLIGDYWELMVWKPMADQSQRGSGLLARRLALSVDSGCGVCSDKKDVSQSGLRYVSAPGDLVGVGVFPVLFSS